MIANRKPKDFSTFEDDPDAQGWMDAIARARVRGDSNFLITVSEEDLVNLICGRRRIEHIESHVKRAAQMMEINDVLLPIVGEQGVVDIIKEMALEHDIDIDWICDHCFHAESIFDIQHLRCAMTLRVPQLPKSCDECTNKYYSSQCHLVCQRAHPRIANPVVDWIYHKVPLEKQWPMDDPYMARFRVTQ